MALSSLLFSSKTLRTVSGQWGWGRTSLHPPPALSKVACAGPARSTPPHTVSPVEGVSTGRVSAGRPRTSEPGPPVYAPRYCLRGDYGKESDGIRGRALSTAPVKSVSSSMLCLSESDSSFESHRSFTAPTLRLSPKGSQQSAASQRFDSKWRSIFVERQWLCPPQGRATYTADPAQWTRVCCSSEPMWELWLSSSASAGMRDWNFSICSGLARFFSR